MRLDAFFGAAPTMTFSNFNNIRCKGLRYCTIHRITIPWYAYILSHTSDGMVYNRSCVHNHANINMNLDAPKPDASLLPIASDSDCTIPDR